MTSNLALRHFRHAFARWPRDTLRPDVSFATRVLAQKEALLAPRAGDATAATTSTAPTSAATVDVKAELEQANALYSLLENRYSTKFKLSKHLLEPLSAPTYYADLLKEIDEAPKRSWLARRLNKWKGYIRFT